MSAFDYVEAERYRQKRFNERAWLQGMYIADAVAVAVNNTVCALLSKGKNDKLTYPERPYGYVKTREEIEIEEENEALKAELYMNQMVEFGKNIGRK